jgi:hypothetical protein
MFILIKICLCILVSDIVLTWLMALTRPHTTIGFPLIKVAMRKKCNAHLEIRSEFSKMLYQNCEDKGKGGLTR